MTYKKHLSGMAFISTFCKVLDIPSDNVQTIVVTAQYDDVVIIEIKYLGDYRMLEYDWGKLKGVPDDRD